MCKFSLRLFIIAIFVIGVMLSVGARETYAATLTLTPATGVAGQEVLVTGTTFDNSSAVTFTWDGAALTTTPTTVTTSATGAIPATGNVSFTVPSGSLGAHTVRASTGTSMIGLATFTISTSAVAITSPTVPTAGLPVGTAIVVTATNLEANKATTFYFDGTAMTTTPTTITSTINGTAEATFTIPDVSYTGNHVIKATNSDYATANVTMVVTTPSITLTPATAVSNMQVTINGTGFKTTSLVTFLINGEALTTDSTVTTSGTGGFAVTFATPHLTVGANTVKAYSYTNLFAVATLTISAPVLTLSPITGPDGLSVYASGTGFKSSADITFRINNDLLPTKTTTNTIGSFGVMITIPSDLQVGASTIRAETTTLVFANATYTVVAPAVSASPTTGAPGTKIILTGSNFNPGASITLKWNGTILKPLEDSLTVNSQGGFTANVTIPNDNAVGTNQIEIKSSSNNVVLVSFVVGNPTLTLSVASGSPGTEITVTGTNFRGNSKIFFKWDNEPAETIRSKIVSGPLGGFFAVITIPKMGRGAHNISAHTSDNEINAVAVFTINSPSLSLSTTSSQSNTRIVVSGTGFGANFLVSFTWDGTTSLSSEEETTTDGAGFFSTAITIPPAVSPGVHVIVATTGIDIFASSSFTIVQGTMVLSRSTGAPLSKIQITGTNFDAYSKVSLFWDESAIKIEENTTDGIGGFVANITIPLSNSGTHYIRATTGQLSNIVADFIVDTPTLTISSDDARTGTKITIQGSGFTAEKNAIILINNRKTKTTPVTVTTDGNGNFLAVGTIPITLYSEITISAYTGENDYSVIKYPIVHSALFNTSATVGKYGFAILLIIGFFLLLRFGYKKLSNPEEVAKLKQRITNLTNNLRSKLNAFIKLGKREKVTALRNLLVNIVTNLITYLKSKFRSD